MPSIDYFECEDCGFRWKDQGPLLFCLNEEDKIEEYILLSTTMDLDIDSKISGDLVESYCPSCDKKIKMVLISTIRKPFNEDSALDKISELVNNEEFSNEYLKPFMKADDLKDDFYIVDFSRNFHSNKSYTCPNCNGEIEKYVLSKNKCPKCNGEIKVVDGMCLDKF